MSSDTIKSGWGYIGKIPAKGDFIKHGLPKSCTDLLHDWQQAVIAVSREQLQGSWRSLYLNAPIWNFSLDATLTGESTLIGSMIPSVDAAGRYFFFTVARLVEGDAIVYWQNRTWAEDSQFFALSVLEDSFSFEQWQHGLSTMKGDLSVVNEFNDKVKLKSLGSDSYIFTEYTVIDSNNLLKYLINEKHDKPCYWWTDGNDTIEPFMFISNGLPSIGKYSAMLDGQWAKWNW
ncbi:type VI secretion system-associated protein TagF [Vibrio metschnikovii]|uniref:type VI secretion system-associated protein TagF n=1 Tax=Vibrio metschnikovii TaxID=28172 RepID=UPI001C30CD23|nr:type VI secretion system-associated protein TagF [Vibrio metschnikovii]